MRFSSDIGGANVPAITEARYGHFITREEVLRKFKFAGGQPAVAQCISKGTFMLDSRVNLMLTINTIDNQCDPCATDTA